MNFSNNSSQESENTVVGSLNCNLPNSIESRKVHNYHQTISCLLKTAISLKVMRTQTPDK